MQSRVIRRQASNAMRVLVAVASVTLGLGIMFGDLFFWSSGNLRGHSYSTLCFLTFSIASGALFLVRLRWIALTILAIHLITTILAVLISGSAIATAMLIISLDVILTTLIFGFPP